MPSLRRRIYSASSAWQFLVIVSLWSLFILALPLFLFALLFHFRKPYLYITYILFVFLATYLVFTENVPHAHPNPTRRTATSPATHTLTLDVDMQLFNYLEFGNADQCVICLSDFQEAQVPALSLPTCQHNFHVDCIAKWLRSHDRCPICNASAFPTHAAQSSHPDHVRVSVAVDISNVNITT